MRGSESKVEFPAQDAEPGSNSTSKVFPTYRGRFDLIDPSDTQSAFATALDKFGYVDVVVNDTGYGLNGSREELLAIRQPD